MKNDSLETIVSKLSFSEIQNSIMKKGENNTASIIFVGVSKKCYHKEYMRKNKGITPLLIVFLVVAVLIIGTAVYYFYFREIVVNRSCTAGALICPDGSTVGKSGPNCEFAPCPQVREWQVYRNGRLGFEIKHPAGWFVWYQNNPTFLDGPIFISDTPETKKIHGLGLPAGGIWLNIAKGICNNPTTNFTSIGDKVVEKTICQGGFQITLGLWEDDTQKQQHQSLLETIAVSFKLLGKVDASSWKTYRNEKFGFEVKYPSYWRVDEYPEAVEIHYTVPSDQRSNTIATGGFNIRYRVFYDKSLGRNWTLDEAVKQSGFFNNKERILVDNIPAIKTSGSSGLHSIINIFAQRDGDERILYISIEPSVAIIPSEKLFEELSLATLENILSTFKFVK